MQKVQDLTADEKLDLIKGYQTTGRKLGFDAAKNAARLDLLEKLSEWEWGQRPGLPSDEGLHEDLYELLDALLHEDEYLSMHDLYDGIPNEFNEAFFNGFKQGIMDFIKKNKKK
jgi:hypothetical protein